MERRSFMATMTTTIGAFSAMFGKLMATTAPVVPPGPGRKPGDFDKRIFRHGSDGWSEIGWREMRAGDRVVTVAVAGGIVHVEAWEVGAKGVMPNATVHNGKPIDAVEIDGKYDLLPRLWGTGKHVEDVELVLSPDTTAVVNDTFNPADMEAFNAAIPGVMYTPPAKPCPYEEFAD